MPVKSLSLFTPGRARRVPLATRGRPDRTESVFGLPGWLTLVQGACPSHWHPSHRAGAGRSGAPRKGSGTDEWARRPNRVGHGVGAVRARTLAAACCGKAWCDHPGRFWPHPAIRFRLRKGQLGGNRDDEGGRMRERRYGSPEGEIHYDELRRAWFDGWTEGVMWMWGKTRQALRQDGQPESVECSVIHHVSSELRSSDGTRPTTR